MKKILLFILIFLLIFTFSCKKKNGGSSTDEPPIVNPDEDGGGKPEEEKSIDISLDKEIIYLDEVATFSVETTPADALYDIEFFSSLEAKDVASRDGFKLTGINAGSLVITVSLRDAQEVTDSITLKVLHPLLELESYEANSIIGAPGEDASTMYNIHYMIKNTKSYALVTTADDVEFENAKAYYGEGYYFEDLNARLDGIFLPRNVWHIVVKDLTPGTSYIYKINNGDDTYSDIYHFKTADGEKTAFLFFTDNHYYTGTDGTDRSAAVSETTIRNALDIDPDIDFVLGAGDRIDTGGNDEIWKKYFEYATSLKLLPFIDTPGNHEYYFNGTGQKDNSFFACYSAGPRNGSATLNGSNCWFIHNQTLFILMDNIKNVGYQEQLDWAANLLETKEYKYSVLVFHIPVNTGDDWDQNYINLIDTYNVDLVLTGHYHSEAVQIYKVGGVNDSGDPLLGSTYFRGSYSGVKSTTLDDAINTACAYIFEITDEKISIQKIFANGKKSSYWEITSKKSEEIIPASNEQLLESINSTFFESSNTLYVTWDAKMYGNVKKISINETNFGKLSTYSVVPTPAYTSLLLEGLLPGYDYHVVIKVEFNDGKTECIEQDIIRHPDLNLRVNNDMLFDTFVEINIDELPSEYMYIVSYFEVYANNKLIGSFNYLNNGEATLRYLIENLNPNTDYEVTLKVYNRYKEFLFAESVNFKTTE